MESGIDFNLANETMTLSLVIMFLCISGFFSAAETAITSLGSLKTKHLMDSKGKAVAHLGFWLKHPNRVLTTILIGNDVANILVSVLIGDMASRLTSSRSIGIATGIATILVLIFGGIVPKAFGKARPEAIGIFSLRVVRVLYFILYPVIFVLSELASWLVKFFGSQDTKTPPITEEELQFLVEMGKRAGVLEDMKEEMISGVFEFDETRVREIMTPRPDIVALPTASKLEEAIAKTVDSGHSRIPVYDESIDNVVGILLAKDILGFVHSGRGKDAFRVREIMRDAYFVPETKLIMAVFKDLKRTKNHLAVVIDEYGGTAGLVTLEDILEEIVGEIQDEFDVEEAKIIEVSPGVYDVAGSVNIDEFLEYFNLEEKDLVTDQEMQTDTISGWMTQTLGRMPQAGQSMNIGPLSLEVAKVERRRIQRIRVLRRTIPEDLGDAQEALTEETTS